MKILISESQLKHIITETTLLDKIKEKYVGDGKVISDEKFNEISLVTNNNIPYTVWLVRMIAENNIPGEDVYKYKQYFEIFNKNKQHFPIKDINQIKTKDQVREFLRKVIEIREISVKKDDGGIDESKSYVTVSEIKKLESVGIKYLGMSEGYQVFQVTPDCYGNGDSYKQYKNILGRCAGREEGAEIDICTIGSQEHFDQYLEDSPGSSYFVMYNFSDPQSPYQFHYESGQFMDKNDNNLIY
jgi:hypothetical protein